LGTIWEQFIIFAAELKALIMKVTAFIRKTAKKNDTDSMATIYFRLRDCKKDIKAASELVINPNHWSSKKQGYKDRVALVSEENKLHLSQSIQDIVSTITEQYTAEADNEWLAMIIDKYHHPNRYKTEEELMLENKPKLLELFAKFLVEHKLSEVRVKNFKVIQRSLARYEMYVRTVKRGRRDFILDVDDVTADTLRDMWDFFENEHIYYEKYPKLYEAFPEKRVPLPRGKNTLIDRFSRIRTFFIWCYDKKITTNRPFDEFPLDECTYGTPYYITLDERDQIFDADLSGYPQLAIQRDIFIFQTLIGCRVSDLYRLTKRNIVNEAIEYIPNLANAKATDILNRGEDEESTEHLRNRYFIKVREPATSGNIYHYRRWVMEVPNVGGVKVFPLWNGNGTVKLAIVNSKMEVADTALINEVKKHIESVRPIGATVTVVSAKNKDITITAKISIIPGASITEITNNFKEKVKDFFKENAFKVNYVSIAKVGNILLDILNVLDYKDLKLNNSFANTVLTDEEIALLSDVNLEVV